MSFLLSFSPTPHLPLPLSRLHGFLPIKAYLPSQPPSPTTAGTSTGTGTGTATSRVRNSVWVNPDGPRNSRLSLLASALSSADPSLLPSLISSASPPLSVADLHLLLPRLTSPAPILPLLHHIVTLSPPPRRPISLFNVALRQAVSFRHWPTAESLLLELISRGLHLETTTLSIAVACAVACEKPDRAAHWFDRLTALGCVPAPSTYSLMIRSSPPDLALSLYERARSAGVPLDVYAFAAVIRHHALSGNLDSALIIFEEMKALRVTPNVFIYNTLLNALNGASRPWQAKSFFTEMIAAGLTPNRGSYVPLLLACARACYHMDALSIYRHMRKEGMEIPVQLYNSILAMCADLRLVDEGLAIFADLEASCTPDQHTFSALLALCSFRGRVEDAEKVLERMEAAGFQLDICVMTSMIHCYGNAGRAEKVVEAFDRVLQLGISPDDKLCGCLLGSLTRVPKEDMGKIIGCIEKADRSLGALVREILDGGSGGSPAFREESEVILAQVSERARRAFCNCLIDLCVQLGLLERACVLLDLAISLRVFDQPFSKSSMQWSLELRRFSQGTALAALHAWVKELSRAMEAGEELPPLLGIHIGQGKHTRKEKGLKAVFQSHLKDMKAPFHESADRPGWLLTTKVAMETWLKSRNSQ